MFYTVVGSEVAEPAQAGSPSMQCWGLIQLTFRPHFLVSYIADDPTETGKVNVTILSSHLSEIAYIAGKQKVLQVALMTPVQGTGEWQMQRITELWCASDPRLERETTAALYVTETNERHIEYWLDSEEARLIKLRQVF
ncbi:MAG: hypothetical protein K0M58_07375 [Thiobacillus sp.]|nr:hypothetical protein [Thiobacillus sp.]